MRTSFVALLAGAGGTLAGLTVPSNATLITLDVTPGSTLAAAVATANADTNLANSYDLRLAPGTYLNDFAPAITRPMTIEGTAGAASTIIQATQDLPNQKGILLTFASLVVRGLTLTGAHIIDALGGNGAGIRDQSTGASTLRVENSIIRDNQEGILLGGSHNQETVVISGSTFRDNGNAGKNTGQEHGIYIGDAASLTVSNSTFCGQVGQGHNIKSRAATTTITGVQSYEGTPGGGCTNAGNASRGIDLPNGGVALISDTNLFQGDGSPNHGMMSFGVEGLTYAQNSLTLANVAFNSPGGGTALQWGGGTSPCTYDPATTFIGVSAPTSVCTDPVVVVPPPVIDPPPVLPPVIDPPVVVVPPPVIDPPPGPVAGPGGDPVPVNEPSTWLLLLASLAGMLLLRHQMRPKV